MQRESSKPGKQGISKVKLALGAASLFLFIVGLKRTFRSDELPGGLQITDEATDTDEQDRGTPEQR